MGLNFDIEKLKKISIVDYLSTHGLKPKRITGRNAAFLSPFREESVPSLIVDMNKNKWHDYGGNNDHGDVIDLLIKIERCNFNRACEILSNGNGIVFNEYVPKKITSEPGVMIHSTGDITDKELLTYACDTRKINEDVLRKYCVQIGISFPHSMKDSKRIYTLLGFKSDLGGYECRNSWMKVCAGAKSHTTIKGKLNSKYILTEGFFDALTYFTYYGILEPQYTMYCLNGSSQFTALNKFIGDKEVLYYGDNDKTGNEIAEQIKKVTDMRHIYDFYKDFNSFLTKK